MSRIASWCSPIFVVLLAACGGATSDEAPPTESTSEGALGLAADPVAVRIVRSENRAKTTVTIGAEEKVDKLLKAVRPGTVPSEEEQATCDSNVSTKLVYLDKAGEEIATVAYECGRGTIKVGASTRGVKVDESKVDDIRETPRTLRDFLWGDTEVTEVALHRLVPPRTENVVVKKKSEIRHLLDSITVGSSARPLPCGYRDGSFGFKLKHGDTEVASGGTSCNILRLQITGEGEEKFLFDKTTLTRIFEDHDGR